MTNEKKATLVGPAKNGEFGFKGNGYHYKLDPPFRDMVDVVVSVAVVERIGVPEAAMFPGNSRGQVDSAWLMNILLGAAEAGGDKALPSLTTGYPGDLLASLGYTVNEPAELGAGGE